MPADKRASIVRSHMVSCDGWMSDPDAAVPPLRGMYVPSKIWLMTFLFYLPKIDSWIFLLKCTKQGISSMEFCMQ